MLRFVLPCFCAILFGLAAFSENAEAASCSQRAAEYAAQNGGRVLSVTADGDKCKGVMLVKEPNKPPRRVRFVVRK